jgi:hypothetical protein
MFCFGLGGREKGQFMFCFGFGGPRKRTSFF